MDRDEEKKRTGQRRQGGREKTAGSIARHDGNCWGFRVPDKEGHLYLARRDRCSTIIDLRVVRKEVETEHREGKRRGQSFNKELGLTVLNTWIGAADRVIERSFFFMYNVSHANSAQDRRDRYFMSGVMENIMFISTTFYT